MTRSDLQQQVHTLAQTLQQRLQADLSQHIDACANGWLHKDLYLHHEEIPDEHLAIVSQVPSEQLPDFHRLLLTRLCTQTLQTSSDDQSGQLLIEELSRIVSDCQARPDDAMMLDQPRKPLEKDLSLSAGRSSPIGGAWIAEKRRTNLHKPGEGRRARLLNRRLVQRIMHRLGQQPEVFVVHTLERRIRYFKAIEHERAMLNLATLLANSPAVGIYRESWFLDPKVAQLSPNLAFLQELPVNHGAQLMFKRTAPPAVLADALDKSPQRKEAYDQGNYSPAVWAYFWPRDAVLSWAEQATG